MKWPILAIAYLALFWLGFIEISRGPIYPEMLKIWNVPKSQGAWFFTLASVAGLCINLSSRWWLPKLGSWNSLRLFSLFLAAACFGFGFSGNHKDGFSIALTSAALFGIGIGGLGIAVNVLTILASPSRLRRQALSGLHTCFGLAAFIAPQFLTLLSVFHIDWQSGLQWIALGPALLVPISFTLKKPESNKQLGKTLGSPLKVRWLIGFTLAFYVGAEMALASRMVLLLRESFSFSPVKATLFLSGFAALLMAGRTVTTFFRWKISNEKIVFISVSLSLLCFLLGLFQYAVFLPLTGLAMSVFFPCFIALISEVYPEWADEIIATTMSAMGIVLIAVHWSIGQLADFRSIRDALLIGPALLIVSLSMLTILKRHGYLDSSLNSKNCNTRNTIGKSAF